MNNKNRSNHRRSGRRPFRIGFSVVIILILGICYVLPVYAGTVGDIVTQVSAVFGSVEYEFGTEDVTGQNLPIHSGYGDYKNGYGSMTVVGPIASDEKQAIFDRLVNYSGSTGSTTTPMKGGEVRQYSMSNGAILAVVLNDYIIVVELIESGDSTTADFQVATQYAQQILDAMEKNGLLIKAAPDLESVISGSETQSGNNVSNNDSTDNTDSTNTEESHNSSETPVVIGPVGNIPGPANNTESVVGVVVPGLLVTALGAIVGLAGGGMTPTGGSSLASSEVTIKRRDSSSSNNVSKESMTNKDSSSLKSSPVIVDGSDVNRKLEVLPYEQGAPPQDSNEIIIDTLGLEESDVIVGDEEISTILTDEMSPSDKSENILIDTSAFDGLAQGSSSDEILISTDELSGGKEFDTEGYDTEGFNREGFGRDGYNSEGYDKEGFDQSGYDAEGYDREGFDQSGYDAEGYDKEGFDESGYDAKGYDKEGFDESGYDAKGYDKEGFDESGYDAKGYDREGFDESGYDAKGYDKEGFDESGYDAKGYDREGFDESGYDPKGYDKEGFDESGYDVEGYDREGFDESGYDAKGYDKEGFDESGYDTEGYDKEGFDESGYDAEGYDKEGFDESGYDAKGYDKEGFDESGYDAKGYDREGFDESGYDVEGYDREGFDESGYDAKGYDREGFDESGYDAKGYDREGFDQSGYNAKGYDREGFDQTGYNAEGYNKDGFGRNGLDQEGYDQNGFNAEGYNREGYDVNGYSVHGYNRSGYDAKGYNKSGYDKSGFDKNGLDKEGYNKSGYKDGVDRDGYRQDGYNKNGYDRDGYDRQGYNADGYDENGYDKTGFREGGYDKDGYDLEGFDYKGYNRDGYDPWGYDRQGYGKDGFHWSGYNQDGLDRNGNAWNDLGYDPNNRNPFDGGPVVIGHPEADGTEGFGVVKKPPLGQPYPKTAEKYGPKTWTTPEKPTAPVTPEVTKTPDPSDEVIHEEVNGPEDTNDTFTQDPSGGQNQSPPETQTTPEIPPDSKPSEMPEAPQDTGIIGPEDPSNTLNQHPLGVENQTAPVTPTTEVPPEPESMVVTTSAQGSQTLIVRDPVTGGWVDSENGMPFDLETHEKNFPQQVKDYQDYIQRNDTLEKSGQTSMQQALDKINKDAKAEFDAIQNEIDNRKMDQLKWNQQQAEWDQQQAQKGTGMGSVLAHTLANVGGDFVQAGKDLAEGSVYIVSEVVDAGKDVWNDPSILTNTMAGTTQDIQNGLNAVKNTAEYIYNNPKKTVEKGIEIGTTLAKGAIKSVIATVRDPKKAWEFVKNTVGVDNFENSLDPNRSLISRIGQVLIGTGKLYTTILSAGQAGTVLKTGAGKITGVVDDLLGVGVKKTGGAAAVKTGIKTALPVNNGSAYVSAPKPANLSGVTNTSQKILQNTSDEWGLQIKIRPPGEKAKQLLESGQAVAKDVDMKAKTAKKLDEILGGPKNSEGLVAYYNPKLPSREVWNTFSETKKIEVAKLYKTRRREFSKLAEEINNHKSSGKYRIVENGPQKGLVTQRMKDGTYKPITSDVDLADIRNFDGTPVRESLKKQVIDSMSKKRGSNVMHEDLISWGPDAKTGFSLKEKVKMVNDLKCGKEGVTSFNPLAKPTSNYLKGAEIKPDSVKTNEEFMRILQNVK